MGTEIEFGHRGAANAARDRVDDEHLTGRYDRRYRTIEVADDAPDDLLEDLEARAAESRAEREAGKVAGTTSTVKALGEVHREPWYALGGLLIGAAVAVAVV